MKDGAPARYRWEILGILWLMIAAVYGFCSFGAPIILADMADDLHLDRLQLGFPSSIYVLMVGLPGPIVAMGLAKFGAWRMLMLGCLLVVAGSLAMALFVQNAAQAALAYGVLVGTGVSSSAFVTSQSIVVQWFDKERALALSILYSGGAIGGLIAAPLLNAVIVAWGGNWRAGWWAIAGIVLVIGMSAAIFVKRSVGQAPSNGSSRTADRRAHVSAEDWTFREAISSVTFWLLVPVFMIGTLSAILFVTHGIPHLKDLGYSGSEAAWVIGIFTGSMLLGKLLLGVFGDRFDPRYIWAILSLAQGAALLIAINPHGPWQLGGLAVGIGAAGGGVMIALTTVLGNYYGAKAFPPLMGLAMATATIGQSATPVLAGLLYDLTGSYDDAFYLTAAGCIMGAVLLLCLRRPERRQRCSPL